ncbi:ABC transporter ATP-binding protein/permease [Alphaproteobacteria bacterium]|nr:ABC transporter ATP-binding protein/permease [Alphaproteobacteria bacterium]
MSKSKPPSPTTDEIIERYNTRRSGSYALIARMLSTYLRPYFGYLLIGVMTNIIVAGTTGVLPWFIQQAIDNVFDERNEVMLYLIPLGIVGISLVKGVATYISNVILQFVGQRTTSNLQSDLFSKIVRGDLAFISQKHSGEYISIFMTDSIRLRDTVNNTVIGLARHLLTVVILIVVMFYMNWYLALIYTLIVIPLGIVLLRSVGRKTRKAARQGLEETGGLSTTVSEALSGLRIVKAYSQEQALVDRAIANIEQVLKYTMKAFRARAASSPIVEFLAGSAVAAIIFYGAQQNYRGLLSTGEFMGFITALLMTFNPLRSAANIQTALQEGVAAGTRIFSILDEPSTIIEKPDAIDTSLKSGNVEFDDVNFSYRTTGAVAVQNINMQIKSGQAIAFVGPSGAGKSTLLNLVLRFFDVTSGAIRIDGHDIRDLSFNSLRQATALVTQDPFLFDDTISANIAFGCHDATDEQIVAAAKLAAADEFIDALPDGYQTSVGEGGLRLSGGQKQRLAIARAILKDAPILLLDEATSALDTASESLVQASLARLMEGRTSLIIAHRLSTIMHADTIYVLDAGQIVEFGNHEELLAKGGLYSQLYTTQFSSDDVLIEKPVTSDEVRK